MRIKEGFVLRNVADCWVVVPIGSRVVDFNGLVSLNDTGAYIWKQLQTEIDREKVVEKLLEEYTIDEKTAKQDLDSFLEILQSKDLLIG